MCAALLLFVAMSQGTAGSAKGSRELALARLAAQEHAVAQVRRFIISWGAILHWHDILPGVVPGRYPG